MNQNEVLSLSLLLPAVFLVNGIIIGRGRRYTIIPRRDRTERIPAHRTPPKAGPTTPKLC